MGCRDTVKTQGLVDGLKGKILPFKLEVTSKKDANNATRFIENEYGTLDVLINNAGITVNSKGSLEVDLEDVRQVMETNFYGAWLITQVMLPLLKKSAAGHIINMSSGMGALGDLTGGYAGYRMSKLALNGLTILLANELKGSIKVNAMCPGWVRTDMGGPGATRSIEQGADTAVWLATSAQIPTGKFFRDRQQIDW